jgi:hypothetical protein
MASTPQHRSAPVLARAKPATCAPGDRAAEKAFACLDGGEAPCVGVLGKSGTGKTEAARRLIPHYLRRSGGVVLVIDDKELRPRYEGQCYRDPDETARRPPAPEPRVIVFRGEPGRMVEVDHEKVAAYQQGLAARGVRTMCVHDEQSDAAKYGQWKAGGRSLLARQYVKGRVIGVGKLWLTQLPAYVPDEPWTQSTAILCFNVDEATIKRLARHRWVDARLAATIRGLPDRSAPRNQRGYFVLLEPECAGDGQIYRF